MSVRPENVERRMEHFLQVCRDAGVRVTHQRMEIFREVAQTGEHPDAETVFRRAKRRLPTVSLDTVYRTLWLLNELDLVRTLGPFRERTRFDANLEGHHHFVCTRCGLTRDFESRDLDAFPVPPAAKRFGRVQAIQIEARGTCRQCATPSLKRNRPRKKEGAR